MNIDFNDPFVQGVIASLVAAVILPSSYYFLKNWQNPAWGCSIFSGAGSKKKPVWIPIEKPWKKKHCAFPIPG
jgi:hypothetical protein